MGSGWPSSGSVQRTGTPLPFEVLWFSENFGFLSQPFNKQLTVYLATWQALGVQHKNTCPHILAWRSGEGGGREGQSRMKTKTM